jgi:hypothetical protein
VSPSQAVVPLGRSARHRDDEDEVEEQLERGGDAVRLVRVARLHPPRSGHGVDVAHGPSVPATASPLFRPGQRGRMPPGRLSRPASEGELGLDDPDQAVGEAAGLVAVGGLDHDAHDRLGA